MLESITLGQIAAAVGIIVALIVGFNKISDTIKESMGKVFKDLMQPFSDKLDDIEKSVANIDKATCKNFLVRCLADLEKGNVMSEVEVERFWEQYKHYTTDLKENSFISEWTERLKKEGKI